MSSDAVRRTATDAASADTLLRKRQIVALLEARLSDALGLWPMLDLGGPQCGEPPWDAGERPIKDAIARQNGIILHLERCVLSM